MKNEWSTYGRLVAYARPYRGRLVLGGVCGVLFAGSTFGSLPALKKFLGHIFDYDAVSTRVILVFGGLLLLLVAVRGVGEYLGAYLVKWVGHRVVMDIRVTLFTHLQNLSVAYFDQNKTGEMISRVINDTNLLQNAVSHVITDLVRQPFVLVGAVVYVLWLDWRLALCSVVLFPLCLVPIIIFGRKVRRASGEGQAYLAEVTSRMQESIGGVRVVKAFGMERHETERFRAQCKRFFGRIMRVVRATEMLGPIIVLVGALGIVAALVYANRTGMAFEDFFTFGLALVILYEPIKKLSKLHALVQQSSAAADRIFEVLDTECKVVNRSGAVTFDEPLESITFEGVHFAYEDAPVLQGINLAVQAGERIAIVGSSGSGKTTLVNLLPRFFDVTQGTVRINGHDVRDLTLHSLRGQLGLVTQEVFLFNESVADNISYGDLGGTQERIEAAARRAHAHEFISEMPEGYQTVIGERGVRLSGGQRQRLAIARAIFRNPPILVLDEATSALDTESERMVQAALDELMEGRTVFAIAHRLSTIQNCHRIIVLDAGRIVEHGTHAELLAAGGIYRRLYELQFEV